MEQIEWVIMGIFMSITVIGYLIWVALTDICDELRKINSTYQKITNKKEGRNEDTKRSIF